MGGRASGAAVGMNRSQKHGRTAWQGWWRQESATVQADDGQTCGARGERSCQNMTVGAAVRGHFV
jgi:hypothetical protein